MIKVDKMELKEHLIVYIAGPMTGLPDFNYPAFKKKEGLLNELGRRASPAIAFTVLNPAVFPFGLPHEAYMQMTLPMLHVSNCIYLLKGWEDSIGSKIELQYALENGYRIFVEGSDELENYLLELSNAERNSPGGFTRA